MNGTKPKCPNLVSRVVGWTRISDSESIPVYGYVACGSGTYEVIDPHPFDKDSGIDPLAVKVRCKACGCEYYIFPALNYHEPAGAK